MLIYKTVQTTQGRKSKFEHNGFIFAVSCSVPGFSDFGRVSTNESTPNNWNKLMDFELQGI
jgi:hypothetical protein